MSKSDRGRKTDVNKTIQPKTRNLEPETFSKAENIDIKKITEQERLKQKS